MCRLEPDRLDGDDAAAAHTMLVAIGKLADGARLRLARRIDETRAWQGSGDASVTEYLARTAGSSKQQARETLDTSWRLTAAAATDTAVRQGRRRPSRPPRSPTVPKPIPTANPTS